MEEILLGNNENKDKNFNLFPPVRFSARGRNERKKEENIKSKIYKTAPNKYKTKATLLEHKGR